MRKCFTMFLALTMALTLGRNALAQDYYTLPEVREQAAKGWHETYTDAYGRTIPVDIDVEVYGGDTLPILRTQLMDKRLDRELAKTYGYFRDEEDLCFYLNNPADEIYKSVRGEKAMIIHRTYGEKVDMDAIYMEEYGAAITMRQMTEHLAGVLAEHGIDATNYFFDQPKEFTVRCRVNRDTLEATTPAAYFAHFWQKMHGLPIVAPVNEIYNNPEEPTCYPQLVLTMQKEDAYSVAMLALEETKMLAQDVPLCGFEAVRMQIEKEIEAGHVRKVFGLRLGYAIYNDSENPKGVRSTYEAKSFYLKPVWMIDCIYMKDPKKEYAVTVHDDELTEVSESAPVERRTLLADAQTGELLEYRERSSVSTAYPGFISWDEVEK